MIPNMRYASCSGLATYQYGRKAPIFKLQDEFLDIENTCLTGKKVHICQYCYHIHTTYHNQCIGASKSVLQW